MPHAGALLTSKEPAQLAYAWLDRTPRNSTRTGARTRALVTSATTSEIHRAYAGNRRVRIGVANQTKKNWAPEPAGRSSLTISKEGADVYGSAARQGVAGGVTVRIDFHMYRTGGVCKLWHNRVRSRLRGTVLESCPQ
jgi:hypothetical protein